MSPYLGMQKWLAEEFAGGEQLIGAADPGRQFLLLRRKVSFYDGCISWASDLWPLISRIAIKEKIFNHSSIDRAIIHPLRCIDWVSVILTRIGPRFSQFPDHWRCMFRKKSLYLLRNTWKGKQEEEQEEEHEEDEDDEDDDESLLMKKLGESEKRTVQNKWFTSELIDRRRHIHRRRSWVWSSKAKCSESSPYFARFLDIRQASLMMSSSWERDGSRGGNKVKLNRDNSSSPKWIDCVKRNGKCEHLFIFLCVHIHCRNCMIFLWTHLLAWVYVSKSIYNYELLNIDQ